MKTLFSTVTILLFIVSIHCCNNSGKKAQTAEGPEITFLEDTTARTIDVMVDGKPFTSYRWPDNVCKPVLFPIYTSAGTEITRGFPIEPREGERVDHPHQIGMWLTYGNVNGNDFWGNGSKGLGTRNPHGGVIKHLGVEKLSGGQGEGILVTSESWLDSTGFELLKERTEYHFLARGSVRIIDRITALTAGSKEVSLPDTKEGMFGIRVARQLELPSEEEITLYGANGEPTDIKVMSNEGISGNYMSSEGITGLEVWGTRARWMDLYGRIGEEEISLVICDHPENQSYPTYWHARGYGLFSANPFGARDFTKGEEELDFSIPANGSITFRYRVIISSGVQLTKEEIDSYADEFSGD